MEFGQRTDRIDDIEDEAGSTLGVGVQDAEPWIESHRHGGQLPLGLQEPEHVVGDVLPIAHRVWAESKDKPKSYRTRKQAPPRQILVFDTETRTDASQALMFGSYQYCRSDSTREDADQWLTPYEDHDEWYRIVLPALKLKDIAVVADAAGLSERRVRDIFAGRVLPHRSNRETLRALVVGQS
jgi:hypothetical protein